MKRFLLAAVICLFSSAIFADTIVLENKKSFDGTVVKWGKGAVSFVIKGDPASEVWELPSEQVVSITLTDGTTFLPFHGYWVNQKDTSDSVQLKEALAKSSGSLTPEDLQSLARLQCYVWEDTVKTPLKRFVHILQVGVMPLSLTGKPAMYSGCLINGYRCSEHLSLGLGLGYDGGGRIGVSPIYADLRFTRAPGKRAMYLVLDAGWSLAYYNGKQLKKSDGLMVNVGGGGRYAIGPHTGLLLELDIKSVNKGDGGYYYSGYGVGQSSNAGRDVAISLMAGIS